jgi:phenylacetyl-CoA:acceptor oxidoreductase subunit 2
MTQTLLDARAMPAWLPWVLAVLLLARVLTFAAYRAALSRVGAPRAALTVLRHLQWPLAGLDIGAAIAVIGAAAAGVAWIAALAGAVAVLAGALLKFTIVVRAAFNQGFALPRLPDRGSRSIAAAVKPGW